MKRFVPAFLLMILLPAILLAGLALRSLRDQEVVVVSQRTQLLQAGCDDLANRIDAFLNDLRGFHSRLVEEIVTSEGDRAERDFNELVRARWSQAAAAAVIGEGGNILSRAATPEVDRLLAVNGDFLNNRSVVEVYQAPPLIRSQAESEPAPDFAEEKTAAKTDATAMKKEAPQKWKVAIPERRSESVPAPAAAPAPMAAMDDRADSAPAMRRNVVPQQAQQSLAREEPAFESSLSELAVSNVMVQDLPAGDPEGAVSRIVDGELHILLWKRHPQRPGVTFWTELDLAAVRAELAGFFDGATRSTAEADASFALLDTDGALVAQTVPGFSTDWSKPLVATEVGPLLPRWEVAAYLLDPAKLDLAAQRLRLALWIVIGALLLSVAGGSVLILRSVGEEMRLASRKTDFVGNVSHELKTPLTSIRMFSELLSRPGSIEPEKARHYAEILSRESARLSRLINRLLDFSRLDRGEIRLEKTPVELDEVVREVAEGLRESFDAAGMELTIETPSECGPVVLGDRDALAQVVLNLLGNALKYAHVGGSVEISVKSEGDSACLSVGDRGPGVPKIHQRRIFEKFYRVDNSINSGVDGSGIGLALCRQIAEQLGGSIRYESRRGGGSIFTLELPLAL